MTSGRRRRSTMGPDHPPPGNPRTQGARCRRPNGFAAHLANERNVDMAIGPVQLLVLGFAQPHFEKHVIAEIERLRATETIRVIDALLVYKDADGELDAEHLGDLSEDDAAERDSKVAALVGLGFDGEDSANGARMGAGARSTNMLGLILDDEWDVIEDIPPKTAAALILLEHQWAVPLRDTVIKASGFRISDGFISPLDLIEIGLMTADEARQMHELETKTAALR